MTVPKVGRRIQEFPLGSSGFHQTIIQDLGKETPNKDDKKMFVHINTGHFEIIVVQNQKLLLFNSFDYNTPEDFFYYIL